MSRQYEKKKLSSGEKFSAINSLRTRDHPYISFVVCRTGHCFVLPQHIYYLTQHTRNMLCCMLWSILCFLLTNVLVTKIL